jgi:signal transduction histidine kinase
MNPKLIFSILLLVFSRSLAQNADSLRIVLANTKEDTMKVQYLLAIANQQGDIDEREREEYCKKALILSEKINYPKGIIVSHIGLATVDNNSGKYEEALDHLNTAIQLLMKYPNDRFLAQAYNSLGATSNAKGDYPAALSWYLKSLALYEKLGKKRTVADLIYNISVVYYATKNYDKAHEYTSRALVEYTLRGEKLFVAMAQNQLGNIAYDQYQYDTALVYYERALKVMEDLKDLSYAVESLTGIGNVYSETKNYDKAVLYHERALKAARETGDESWIANSLMNLGRDYRYTNNANRSEAMLKEAVALSEKTGAKKISCDAYLALAELYESRRNYKEALKYENLYAAWKDSLYNEENATLINDLNTKYENEKKEKSIALLNAKLSDEQKSQELLQAKVSEKNTIIGSVIGGTILVLISGFLFYSRQRLRQKNKFQEELNEQQKNTAGTIIQMLEDERNRIARELHDGVGTYISTLKINLQVLEHNIADEKLNPYKNNSALLDKTSEELRKITKGLSSEALQEKGLAPALHELVNSIPASDTLQVQFLTDETDHRFDALLETNYYRVAQELINNSMKHSRASKISLQLIDHDTDLLLMLEDNGIGFDMEQSTMGMGLKNIRNRIGFLGGTFKIESILEKGSTFIIEVPKKAA